MSFIFIPNNTKVPYNKTNLAEVMYVLQLLESIEFHYKALKFDFKAMYITMESLVFSPYRGEFSNKLVTND